MAESYEIPDKETRLKIDLEDDVRSFLFGRLAWNRIPPEERVRLRMIGVDAKRLRRPTYLAVSSMSEEVPPGEDVGECIVGAEGVMSHRAEHVIHLAFKCGNPAHHYHYSTFGIETVRSLASACEAAWPGSISGDMLESVLADQEPVDLSPDVLDPGEDDIPFDESGLDDDDEDELFL